MVRAETNNRVARIELARLDKKNAITTEMYVQLAEALAAADADREVRAVLLHGSRDCFTAGNDISDFLKRPPGQQSPSRPFFEILPALAELPPESIRLTKRLMKSVHADAVKQQIGEEGRIFVERLASPEAKEAMSAFLAKRKPDFSRF